MNSAAAAAVVDPAADHRPIERKKLAKFGAHATSLVQFFITSTNAWIVFNANDVANVSCHLTPAIVADRTPALSLTGIAQRWGLNIVSLYLYGPAIECRALDEQYAQNCHTLLDAPLPAACAEVAPLLGGRCYGTESITVFALALFCLSNVASLVAFMWLDAALDFHADEYDAHRIRCSSFPHFITRRRFTLVLLPTALFPLLAIFLMATSLERGACVFESGPYMAFALVFIWAVVTIVVVHSYEKVRRRFDEASSGIVPVALGDDEYESF
jgi:hypothetical protein